MFDLRSILIFAITAGAALSGAMAQSVYKCGTTYSQTPCNSAVSLDVSDNRTAAQKAQANSIAANQASTANAMEKARLQQNAKLNTQAQARQRSANAAKPKAQDAAPESEESPILSAKNTHKKHRKTSAPPAFFTAKAAPAPKP